MSTSVRAERSVRISHAGGAARNRMRRAIFPVAVAAHFQEEETHQAQKRRAPTWYPSLAFRSYAFTRTKEMTWGEAGTPGAQTGESGGAGVPFCSTEARKLCVTWTKHAKNRRFSIVPKHSKYYFISSAALSSI